MDEKKKYEISDEALKQVIGGVSVGERVKVDAQMVRYCPGCGKLATIVFGKVAGKMHYEKRKCYFADVISDCCGHVEKALKSVCLPM